MTYVLDACAIIAFLRREKGGEGVRDLLLDNNNHFYCHALNCCEVFYDFLRLSNQMDADEVVALLPTLGIKIREDMDEDLWKFAGQIKAEIKRIALADCFAVALTHRLGATLLTSDHAEFDQISKRDFCKVRFIR